MKEKIKLAFTPIGKELPFYAIISGWGLASGEPQWGICGAAATYAVFSLVKYDILSHFGESAQALKASLNYSKSIFNHTLDNILTKDADKFYDTLFYKVKPI